MHGRADLTVVRHSPVDGERHGARCDGVRPAHGLDVKVRFHAVARVAALGDLDPRSHLLTDRDPQTPSPQVTQRDDWTSLDCQHDVVASQCRPAVRCPSPLAQCVDDRGNAAVRRVIGMSVHDGKYLARRWRQHRPSETGEACWGLRSEPGANSDRSSPSVRINRNQVHGQRTGVQLGAVAGDPVCRAVAHRPRPDQRIGQFEGWGLRRRHSSIVADARAG